MSCVQCRSRLLPWLKQELSEASALEVEQHLSSCPECSRVAANERVVLESLQVRQRIPPPSPGFESRVLDRTTGRAGTGRGRTWSTPIVGGAIAAALVLGITLGFGLQPGNGTDTVAPELVEQNTGQDLPALRNLRLAFSSSRPLEDVTLTLELPPHVEMARYPGYQRLSWKVDLDQGENLVNLPLNILFEGQGEIVARLDDGERTQTFRADLSASGRSNNMDKAEPSS